MGIIKTNPIPKVIIKEKYCFKELPKNAQVYIQSLEKFIETKVASISTSPERKDTILIENPFS